MTQPILAERGRPITEHNSRWKTLGAMWMQEFAQTLTNPERDALADGLALLLERPARRQRPTQSRPDRHTHASCCPGVS